MILSEIEEYLKKKHVILDEDVLEDIEKHLAQAQQEQNETLANTCWCLREIYKIQKSFLSVYNNLKKGKFEEAWCGLERTDIMIGFLEENYDVGNSLTDPFSIVFIKTMIPRYEKLFPKYLFTSRETLIKKQKCSICGADTKLRGGCKHKLGKLYCGEMCSYIVTEAKLLGVAVVKDPFDKYAVMHVEGMEYDYSMIRQLSQGLKSPYDYFNINISKRMRDIYKGVERNDLCPCGSGKKYKKCCLGTDAVNEDHYEVSLLYNGGNLRIE